MDVDISYDITQSKVANQNTNTGIYVPPIIPVQQTTRTTDQEPSPIWKYLPVTLKGDALLPRTTQIHTLPASGRFSTHFHPPMSVKTVKGSDIETSSVGWTEWFFNPSTDQFEEWKLTPVVVTAHKTGYNDKKYMGWAWRGAGGALPDITVDVTEDQAYASVANAVLYFKCLYLMDYNASAYIGASIALSAKRFTFNPFSAPHVVGCIDIVCEYYGLSTTPSAGTTQRYDRDTTLISPRTVVDVPYPYDHYATSAAKLALNEKIKNWNTENWVHPGASFTGEEFVDPFTPRYSYEKRLNISAGDSFNSE